MHTFICEDMEDCKKKTVMPQENISNHSFNVTSVAKK
jgi:hypothetical protein